MSELRPALVALLRPFIANLTPATKVFRMPVRGKTVRMFREDLQDAGIRYRDDANRVADFHGLRHTFITNLEMGGVHPQTAQQLARHSTIGLTMDRYTHSLRDDELAALNALPDLAQPTVEARRVTRTNNAKRVDSVLAFCLVHYGERETNSRGAGGQTGDIVPRAQVATNTGKTAKLHGIQAPGEVSERLKEPVSKTGVAPSVTVGSNPTLSAFLFAPAESPWQIRTSSVRG